MRLRVELERKSDALREQICAGIRKDARIRELTAELEGTKRRASTHQVLALSLLHSNRNMSFYVRLGDVPYNSHNFNANGAIFINPEPSVFNVVRNDRFGFFALCNFFFNFT